MCLMRFFDNGIEIGEKPLTVQSFRDNDSL